MKNRIIQMSRLLVLLLLAVYCVNCKKTPKKEMEELVAQEVSTKDTILENLQKNTVLDLPFDANTLDQSIYENDVEPYGVKYKEDRHGNANAAIYFDGNDYVKVPHSNQFNFGLNDDFAISFWIKFSTQIATHYEDNDILSKWVHEEGGSRGKGYPFVVRITNQTNENPFALGGARYGGECVKSNGAGQVENLGDNQFHYIVFMKSGDMLSFYVDGVLTMEQKQEIPCDVQNEAPLMIGGRVANAAADKNWFTGTLDDLLILNRALTEEEIQYLYRK